VASWVLSPSSAKKIAAKTERLLTRLITGRQKQSGSRAALFAFRVNAILMSILA
jgi:hypothetical protein